MTDHQEELDIEVTDENAVVTDDDFAQLIDVPEDVEKTYAKMKEGDIVFDEFLKKNFLLYAYSVLTDRALPEVRDGLLPVQRRIIVAMNDRNLNSKAAYAKCAKIVGDTMGSYHPHGDSSIYGALARMAQDWSMSVCPIDGHGQFGSVDGDNPAAMRYTEARMSVAAELMVSDLHPEILPDDYGRNFDESKIEPNVLPTGFPNLLINGAVGIAVGMTSRFLPHNPGEAIDLCLWRLNNPEATDEAICKRIKGPDFPTGGLIVDNDELRNSYLTGEGKITALAATHIEPIQGGREKIVITQLPWMVNKKTLMEKINAKYKTGAYPELVDLNDFSDLQDAIRIEIPLKRGANATAVLRRLRKDADLRVTYGVQMNALVGGQPVTVNLPILIDEFLEFRRYIVVKRAEKRIREIDIRLRKLDAYLKALSAIDAVVALIKKAADKPTAKLGLQKLLKIDDEQAQWVVELPIGNLTKLDTFKLKEEAQNLKTEKKELQKLIKTPALITEVVASEMKEVGKTIARPRVSNIVTAEGSDTSSIEEEAVQTIISEPCTLLLSRAGTALCGSGTIQRGASMIIDDEDRIVSIDEGTNTGEDKIVFSGSGKAFRLRLAELPLESRRTKGVKLSTVVGIESGDTIAGVSSVPDEKAEGSALFVYKSGTVKRSAWSEFASATTQASLQLSHQRVMR